MAEAPSAYPLTWPAGKSRTPRSQRKEGAFKRGGSRLTVAAGADRLEDEVARLGGCYLLISSNMEVTLSGRPRSGQRAPEDPGVCAYFQMKGTPYALACDRYTTVADNLGAIAAHIDATRAITRHGVATAEETLQAFQALPSPGTVHVRKWWDVLGVPSSASLADVELGYRTRACEVHPDRGGTDEQMAELNAARDAARRALGA